MTELLEQAEGQWRDEISLSYPLWHNIPVIKKGKSELKRDWHFSTDLKRIFALIINDSSLQQKFQEIVPKYWEGNPEEIALHTLHYLLYHELYHPLEAPRSKDDNKQIHQAIRNGILKAEPALSPLEQLLKVMASQNIVKDFILDNRFFIDNQEWNHVQKDIIPVWDLLELYDASSKTDFYSITRYIYGMLYGPKKTHPFFEEKTGGDGITAAKESINALLKKEADKSLIGKLKSAFSKDSFFNDADEIAKDIREVFSGEDRYIGIERFISALSKYIQKDMPEGRPDYSGEGSGSSSQDILQDLLDGMDEPEQQSFLEELTSQIKSPEFSLGVENSVSSWNINQDDFNSIELSAIHEFYKRNHPAVKIIGSAKKGETVLIGKEEKFVLKNTRILTEGQLSKLNLARIARFQQRTRLPTLIQLDKGLYRLNEYDIKERELKGIAYVDQFLELSDIYSFYLDSSGSMFGGNNNGFNDGSSWDMLSSVLYGYIDVLCQASKELHKSSLLQFNNFADKQICSLEIGVQDFWEKPTKDILKVLFKPENGYSVEDLNINAQTNGKKVTYVMVTDGALCISGRAERESRKMRQLAKQPNAHVILFEIGGSYSLGNAVKKDPNVHYFPVYDKNKMFQDGLEVLLAK